jgi:hypothetical protein
MGSGMLSIRPFGLRLTPDTGGCAPEGLKSTQAFVTMPLLVAIALRGRQVGAKLLLAPYQKD